jgi:uncharacterized protein YjbJ (UPF0337 family)
MSRGDNAKNTTQIVNVNSEEAAGRASRNETRVEDGTVDQIMGNIKHAREKINDAVKK